MSKKYDFIIVGAGFAGASCARLLTNKGYKCLIIEERPFVSGNCISFNQKGIEIHALGPHIIRTNDEEVWNFLNVNGDIRKFYPQIKTFNNGKLYTTALNSQLLYEIFGGPWINNLEESLKKDIIHSDTITNIKEYCLSNFGTSIYELLYENYFGKIFNKPCDELSLENFIDISKISFINSSNTYSEKYQGIPRKGYKEYVEGMIGDDIDILLNTDFLKHKDKFIEMGDYVIYTGEIDKFFGYCIGNLQWRSVIFNLEDQSEKTSNMTGNAITNFSDNSAGWYRMTEHKWLDPENNKDNKNTLTTSEFGVDWERGMDAYYPILTIESVNLYNRYVKKLKADYPNILLCGRKAEYNFATISDVVKSAINLTDKFPYKE